MGKSEEGNQSVNETFMIRKTAATEASKMLEAALLQMDGIISGACVDGNSEANSDWKDVVKEATRNLVSAIQNTPNLPPPSDAKTAKILLQWLQPACIARYARIIALHGNIPNEAYAGNSLPPAYTTPYSSKMIHHFPNNTSAFERNSNVASVHPCVSQFHPSLESANIGYCGSQLGHSTDNLSSLPAGRNHQFSRYGGSWDRRRKKSSNSRVNHAQRTKLRNDLEHQRKLENERGALHMENSVLIEQVEAQSTKILELESMLREKKDSLRQMEEALQKEVLARSTLETQKLELLSTLSEMKLRQASLEHENFILRSTSSQSNEERFGRHTGQYSSLPRPSTSSKAAVSFGKNPTNLFLGAHMAIPLAAKGVSARCLSAPILAEEEQVITNETSTQHLEASPSKSLAEHSMEEISTWLSRLGLECYAAELRRWGATGSKLLDASYNQIEKELDIKNTLHRKKLLYAIESERCNGIGFLGSDKMDNSAVLRWLDDVGLPQHKEAFQNAKIDGRVLHRLTTEDLLNLGVTAQLHATSLRRGIQVLRELNFEFDNLERRSINENGSGRSNIALWTNHRVMEWLRVVDLAEYAPNMRGSGVHGGLMVHEGRFTSELLAAILSIPPAKTLLRRHLTTHFNQILGREVVQHKREMENSIGFVPLTLTARLKVPKKSQFTLKRKKSKNEMDYGNLVCPLTASPPGTPSTPSSTPGSPNLNSPTL